MPETKPNLTMKAEVESPWRVAWKRFKKNKLALLGLFIILIMALMAIFAPWISPYDPNETDILNTKEPPSGEHWLGTDRIGRDLFSRLIYAGRISLTVGLVSMSISVLIGTILGLLAGFYGGWIDSLISRLVDIFLSIPFLILAVTVISVFGPSLYNIMVVIGVISWPGLCRLVRGQILSLREREFIEAARALGSSDRRIMYRHLLSNTFAPIIVSATLRVASAILLEAGMSFLGLGVQPPKTSWGAMLQTANNVVVLKNMPWFWIPPGIMIMLAVLSINFVGDGLRDALDPKLKE
ncbi:MAG: oligopeptide ABC transporter permease [Halanaerobium sp.]|nr:oligopeptide ABC transporter permease [Halanaerobium sp.]